VRLTVIGSSPAWPNPGSAHSGYMLEADGSRVLLDCGPGVLGRLREETKWPDVDAIAITHWHLDHWGDLVPWVWGSTLGPGEGTAPPQVWVPPEGRELLKTIGQRLGRPEMFENAFDLIAGSELQAHTAIRLSKQMSSVLKSRPGVCVRSPPTAGLNRSCPA
jgi:ribonuclease BN (tRNA processing enzyme)